MDEVAIRPVVLADAGSIVRIYNRYIAESTVTFEEEPLAIADVESRILKVIDRYPWLALESDGIVRAYAYAGAYHARGAYRHTVEISVYVEKGFEGRGFGSRLYGALFPLLESDDIHVVIAGIALPNPGSVALHERFGMEKVAHFREVGRKFGQWIDVAHWQRILRD
jgi:L-amino acid N-acyltransferase YncA